MVSKDDVLNFLLEPFWINDENIVMSLCGVKR